MEFQEWNLICSGEGCDARLAKCYGGLDGEIPLLSATLEPGYGPEGDGIWRRTRKGRYGGLPRARAMRKGIGAFRAASAFEPVIETREPAEGTPKHRRWKERQTQQLFGAMVRYSGAERARQEIDRMVHSLTGNRAPNRPEIPRGETILVECYDYRCGGLVAISLPSQP